MTDEQELELGMRYRRNAEPHDYVWSVSQIDGHVTIRTTTGWVGMPVEQFRQEFTVAPKRPRKSG